MSSFPQPRAKSHAPATEPYPATVRLRRNVLHRKLVPIGSAAVESESESDRVSHRGIRLRRVLVTGANGFLGGHLVEALQRRNIEVRAAVRSTADRQFLESLDIEPKQVEWNDESALASAAQGVDAVFHLAATIAAVQSHTLYEINVGLTERLARACASLESPPVFLYCSSIAAGGPSPRGQLRTESHRPHPISDYGRSKRGGEVVLEKLAPRIPATIVRPGIVVGERNRELLPIYQMIKAVRMHFVAGIHSPQLSLVHASDACELMIRAVERGERLPACRDPESFGEGIYYSSAWEAPNYGQLGRMIGEAMGLGSPFILHLIEPFSWVVGWFGEMAAGIQGVAPAISRDKIREALASNWATSPAKAEEDLGVFASAPLAKRLAELGNWYREAGWL